MANYQQFVVAESGFYVVFNTESLFFYVNNRQFRAACDNAKGLLVDGIGVRFLIRLLGRKVDRFHGPDFFLHVLEDQNLDNYLVFGGTAEAHRKLESKFPEKRFVFVAEKIDETDFNPVNWPEVKSAAVILVCLGIVKQEIVGEQISRCNTCARVVGVGASLDFVSGHKKRSGVFFQRCGLEWFPRLIREPRMIPRIYRSLVGLLSALWFMCFKYPANSE